MGLLFSLPSNILLSRLSSLREHNSEYCSAAPTSVTKKTIIVDTILILKNTCDIRVRNNY